jgi:DNA-binding transcriptional ArsR family regulator
MEDGPNIRGLAQDPARTNMLSALMRGQALTASELAQEAGVMLSTASGHLGKLADASLVTIEKQGRHHDSRLSGDVGSVLEGLMGVAARTGHLRLRTGPRDPELRRAGVCCDHLAGDAAVRMYDRLEVAGMIAATDNGTVRLTKAGERFFSALGIDLNAVPFARRPLCRACLDWSERRHHVAGALGAALLDYIYGRRWARRVPNSRVVTFTKTDAMMPRA